MQQCIMKRNSLLRQRTETCEIYRHVLVKIAPPLPEQRSFRISRIRWGVQAAWC